MRELFTNNSDYITDKVNVITHYGIFTKMGLQTANPAYYCLFMRNFCIFMQDCHIRNITIFGSTWSGDVSIKAMMLEKMSVMLRHFCTMLMLMVLVLPGPLWPTRDKT